ncbi:hypothetical protein [Streptomyces ficellus]|uniref:Uncharacterized protein n=1 Tax=Streptomyces ficellus TaxID=1977088 RepID=A0A6I6FMD4_9ACTN|nr:hypothetical protein [Streptomyces ficellus]QGV77446.1 hypothetical protein EIZ62_03660 [Streptomyces ficellus]
MSGLWGHGGAYQEWVEFLRRWAAFEPVDPGALPAVDEGTYDGDTMARLTAHAGRALGTRLQAWADTLVRAMEAATDEFSAGRELTQARTGLQSIRAVARHPGLPERLREQLGELVDRQVPDLQAQLERSLEEAARAEGPDTHWVEQRRRTLRDNALTRVLAQEPAPPAWQPSSGPRADAWAYDPAAAPRRRIVTD